MEVNICGMKHKIIECQDHFDNDTHMGKIDYGKCQIKINSEMPKQLKESTLCHEILHGIFVHIGREDLAFDETLITALGNAVNQAFSVKKLDK